MDRFGAAMQGHEFSQTAVQGTVYVIGHRQPDTDSICSVIGYAALLRQLRGGSYIPARCGELNRESSFALERFGADPPEYIGSVEPTVSDLPYLDTRIVTGDIPAIDAVTMMERLNMRNMPVTDGQGRLLGLISEHGLARAYISVQGIGQLALPPIRVEVLARILNAQVLANAGRTLGGMVYTAIDALHVALSKLKHGDVVIVGDNEPAQLAFLASGVGALVIANGAPAGERVIREAAAKGISILSTSLDAFSVGKMINLSLPVEMVMETDVPRVRMEEPLELVKDLISNSKYRTACVVDREGRFLGQIARSALMQEVQKKVILLDHNEPGQAVDGIEEAEILEIIDHHRLSAITTLKPVRFLNDPVGSTSTIVVRKYQEAGIEPATGVAGLLLSGILSDTLVLKMSTATDEDRKAVEYLASLTGIEPMEYGMELVRRGMSLDGVPIEEVLTRDLKRYRLRERDVVVSQVLLPGFEFSRAHGEEIAGGLMRLRERYRADLFVSLFTSVIDEASQVFASSDEITLRKLGFAEQPVLLKGVMSRKKDFLPMLGERLKGL